MVQIKVMKTIQIYIRQKTLKFVIMGSIPLHYKLNKN